jgi:cytoskeletal protein RodZ
MPMERKIGDFGNRLRDARERKGLSLREIANVTKISVQALEGLEKHDISRLPGGIFGRAFVRSYAVETGLDPEETVEEFVRQFPQQSVTVGHPSTRIEDGEAIDSHRRVVSVALWLVGVAIVAAGLILYFGLGG